MIIIPAINNYEHHHFPSFSHSPIPIHSLRLAPAFGKDLARHLVKQVLRYLDHLRDPQNEESYGRVCALAWRVVDAAPGAWAMGDVSDDSDVVENQQITDQRWGFEEWDLNVAP